MGGLWNQTGKILKISTTCWSKPENLTKRYLKDKMFWQILEALALMVLNQWDSLNLEISSLMLMAFLTSEPHLVNSHCLIPVSCLPKKSESSFPLSEHSPMFWKKETLTPMIPLNFCDTPKTS